MICYDEGLWLETPALESLYSIQIILSTKLVRPNVRNFKLQLAGYLYNKKPVCFCAHN